MKKLVHEIDPKESLKLPRVAVIETDNIEYAVRINSPERGKSSLTQIMFVRVPTHPPLAMIVTEPVENFADYIMISSGAEKPIPPAVDLKGLQL